MRALLSPAAAAILAAAIITMAGCAHQRVTNEPQSFAPSPHAAAPHLALDEPLRVMTYNILKGGTELGMPLSRTAEVILAARADVVVLQETNGSMSRLAQLLGYGAHQINESVSILSRVPIAERGSHGIHVQPWPDLDLWVLGVHLEAYPYGPYDLRDNPALTEAELVNVAISTRGHQIAPVLAFARPLIAQGRHVLLAGDFNEPSHLDWSRRAAEAALNFGRPVQWPTALAVQQAGFLDAWRAMHPDEIAKRGETWTPRPDRNEVHDRIDLIHIAGPRLLLADAELVGENESNADIAVDPYPSDHRAVVVTLRRMDLQTQ